GRAWGSAGPPSVSKRLPAPLSAFRATKALRSPMANRRPSGPSVVAGRYPASTSAFTPAAVRSSSDAASSRPTIRDFPTRSLTGAPPPAAARERARVHTGSLAALAHCLLFDAVDRRPYRAAAALHCPSRSAP